MADDKFDHLFIAASNFDDAQRFYRDSLGWRVIASWGEDGGRRGAGLSAHDGPW
jgi:catechol 2,3-dioxygenase-like lactoylglutathione lyase family enzyme